MRGTLAKMKEAKETADSKEKVAVMIAQRQIAEAMAMEMVEKVEAYKKEEAVMSQE